MHDLCITLAMKMNTTYHALILADGGQNVGFGHISRCLSIAEGLTDVNISSTLVSAALPDFIIERAATSNVSTKQLANDPVEGLRNLAETSPPDLLIVDSYVLDDEARTTIANMCNKVVYLDDGFDHNHPNASMIINPSPFTQNKRYPPQAHLLLGAKYALLSRSYWPENRPDLPSANIQNHILISFGGADPMGLTCAVAEDVLRKIDNAMLDIVIPGDPSARFDELKKDARVRLHHGLQSLAPLMTSAGLAITQVGGTMGELATMGVPGIVVVQQGASSDFLSHHPDLDWMTAIDGDIKDQQNLPSIIARKAAKIWADDKTTDSMASAGQRIVDGRGIERISIEIRKLLEG